MHKNYETRKPAVVVIELIFKLIGWLALGFAIAVFVGAVLADFNVLPNGNPIGFIQKISGSMTKLSVTPEKNVFQLVAFFCMAIGMLFLGLTSSRKVAGKITFVIFWLLGVAAIIALLAGNRQGGLEILDKKQELFKLAQKSEFAKLTNVGLGGFFIARLVFGLYLLAFLAFLEMHNASKPSTIFTTIAVTLIIICGILLIVTPVAVKDATSSTYKWLVYISRMIIYGGSLLVVVGSVFAIFEFIFGLVRIGKR